MDNAGRTAEAILLYIPSPGFSRNISFGGKVHEKPEDEDLHGFEIFPHH